MFRPFARNRKSVAACRTWPTLPGADGNLSEKTVCIESTTRSAGLIAIDFLDQPLDAGFGEQIERRTTNAEALASGLDLVLGFLAGSVEDGADVRGKVGGGLEQQRGLADSRRPTEKHQRSRHEAATEHPVELADPSAQALGDCRVDVRVQLRATPAESRDSRRAPAPWPPREVSLRRTCSIRRNRDSDRATYWTARRNAGRTKTDLGLALRKDRLRLHSGLPEQRVSLHVRARAFPTARLPFRDCPHSPVSDDFAAQLTSRSTGPPDAPGRNFNRCEPRGGKICVFPTGPDCRECDLPTGSPGVPLLASVDSRRSTPTDNGDLADDCRMPSGAILDTLRPLSVLNSKSLSPRIVSSKLYFALSNTDQSARRADTTSHGIVPIVAAISRAVISSSPWRPIMTTSSPGDTSRPVTSIVIMSMHTEPTTGTRLPAYEHGGASTQPKIEAVRVAGRHDRQRARSVRLQRRP